MNKFYEFEKKEYHDKEEDIRSRKSIDKWIFRLLLVVIGLVPLIVMGSLVVVQTPLITNVNVLLGGTKGDLFTHYKSLVVIIVTVISAIMFLMKILFMNGEIRKTKLNYAIGIFAIAIVVSTIFSPNVSIALQGQYNRADGAISWLCYLTLFFIAMNIEYPKKVLNYILYSLYPFVVINLFITTMSFYGKDLLQYIPIQKFMTLLLPAGANIGAGSILVGTLNQWNYMSGMFAIMTVMFLIAAVLEKSIGQAIGHLLIAVISMAIMLMSISTSGFLTVCAMMLAVAFAIIKTGKKSKGLIMIAVFLIATTSVFHVLASRDFRVWTESIGFIAKTNPYVKETPITMGEGSKLEFNWIDKVYAAEKFELPVLPERAIASGSGRAFIWTETLNLVKKQPLLGYGLDTLMYNFPHYSIKARAGMYDENTIIDKPHNMYVGWLYGTGVLGFVSAMAIVILTITISLREAVKKNRLTIWVLGIAWGAYLIQALFNDSLPGTSAIMWILAGIMLAVTFENKEQLNGRDN